MTAREVIDKLYRESHTKVPSTAGITTALYAEGYDLPSSLRKTWEYRLCRVKLPSQYSRHRDRTRAYRTIDRWLADQIDAKQNEKQEVPA